MSLNNPNLLALVTFLAGSGITLSGIQIPLLGFSLLAASCILMGYAVFETRNVPGSFVEKFRLFWTLRFGGQVPLPVAARLAYEAARRERTVWADAAEKLSVDTSPEAVLDYVATYFGMHVPITGQRAPSTLDEVINPDTARKGSFEGGAQQLVMDDNRTIYTQLRVSAGDVRTMTALLTDNVAEPSETGRRS